MVGFFYFYLMDRLLQEIIQRKDNFVCKHTGEELLLIPLKDNVADFNQYLVLNELGAYIWDLLEAQTTFDNVHGKVYAAFEVSSTQLQTDLELFITTLHQYTCKQ